MSESSFFVTPKQFMLASDNAFEVLDAMVESCEVSTCGLSIDASVIDSSICASCESCSNPNPEFATRTIEVLTKTDLLMRAGLARPEAEALAEVENGVQAVELAVEIDRGETEEFPRAELSKAATQINTDGFAWLGSIMYPVSRPDIVGKHGREIFVGEQVLVIS
jgi:hypothetical protein